MDNEKFGKFIKDLRKKSNLTQKQLGEKLNVTDKAVSKWERGLSFPDITIINLLAENFRITASEILNAKLGNKEEVDLDKAIKEAVEKITNLNEKKEQRIKKIKKYLGITSLVIFVISSIIQLGYLLVLKNHNYEYVIDYIFYIINEVIIFTAILVFIFLIKKNKIRKLFILIIIFIVLSMINIVYMINNGFENDCVVSISKDFSNELVLKRNKRTGSTIYYNNKKLFIFAKSKEQLSYEIEGDIKYQWLVNDICSVTYKDKDNQLREFVATYGDRGNGVSYYKVLPSLQGDWQVFSQYGKQTQIIVDTKGITIKKDGKSELFENENCKQFGTIALVLYDKEKPIYVIGLNKDCKIDDKTGIIEKNGTITLSKVSMEKTKEEVLNCITYKNESDLSYYNVVSVAANEYIIKNGLLYISYDGKNVIQVPGDFNDMKSKYNDYNYQISKEKTIFFYEINQKRFLVYSDDMGINWKTVEIENNASIQNIQFISSDIGYMLEFADAAMGIASGKIVRTEDGGNTWNDVSYGVGDENEKIFKTSSQMKFINENLGFLTMPQTGGEYSYIYISKDSGKTFDKLSIFDSEIYDYCNLPTEDEGKIYLKISQGSDGDYNGGDSKIYYSIDNGKTWTLQN